MNETYDTIDRRNVVERHRIHWNKLDGVVAVGNGEFCFGADATGLQTFAGFSMAHWGWHSFPLPEGWTKKQVPSTGTFQQGSNTVPDVSCDDKPELWQWMTDNPHRMKLGRLMFCRPGGAPIAPEAITDINREMNVWTGCHQTTFTFEGELVSVTTLVDQERDVVAVKAHSPALAQGALEASLVFEYPTLNDIAGRPAVPDEEGLHRTETLALSPHELAAKRTVDDETVYVTLACSSGSVVATYSEHRFAIRSQVDGELCFSCEFAREARSTPLPQLEDVRAFSSTGWKRFWESGGAIDLSQSSDPRWRELERRVVLSQYHMRAQSAGSWPSPEIGLMGLDPWRGQFHMEMLWWHLAHYALWNRWEMAEKALACYRTFLPRARELAEQLGYKGAMWPKAVGPEGRSAPWGGNFALLWKQPHPIFFAELEYRQRPTRATLDRWAEVLEATAELMADYPVWDEERQCLSLMPCVLPSETGKTRDGVFDLVYWRWGLSKAQEWRERLGLERRAQWDEVCDKLAPLPMANGIYVRTDEPGTRHNSKNYSHPDGVGVYGMLPLTKGLDPEIAARTTRQIWESWQWERCWGWDFPWTAMSAARTGQPELAVDALLAEAGNRNEYDETGLNQGGPCHYLPGNGGLLYAIAMMAAGWDGCESEHTAPGFPQDGSWTVRWEGLCPAI